MRILLSRSSADQFVGGAELSARDITRCLVSQGHECLLVTNIRRSAMKKGLAKGVLRYSLWPRKNSSKLSKLLYLPRLIVLAIHYLLITLAFRPQVLCPQSREDQVVLTHIGRLLRIPVVWRDPGDLVPQLDHKPSSLLQRLNRKLLVGAIERSSAIFTLNEDDKVIIQNHVPKIGNSHVSVIASDILFDDYHPTKLHKQRGDRVVIGTISQLYPHKGVDVLIRAFKELLKNKPELELQIVSNGPEKAALQKLAGETSVVFLGHLSSVSDWLSQIDIYTQPALREGWGRTVKEARYFGKPIIASRTGGIVKQIVNEQTGLLVTPGSVEELQAALQRLLDDTKLQTRLASAAKRSALSEGDWNRTVSEKIAPLFKSVLQQR